MQVMKWSIIALAVAAGTSQMAVAAGQADSKGFVEDSSFTVLNRILYMNRDFRNGGTNTNAVTGKTNGYREETGLGIRALYESGFTQGIVGFGLDAHSLTSVKLDSGKGRYGNGLFAQDSEGAGQDTQSELGGAVKLRFSNTVLKYGNQFVASPVFATDDSRILPEVATGTLITSNEIEGLEIIAGHFSGMSSQIHTAHDDMGLKSADIVGATYAFNENFSAAVHASDVEDYWKKQYVNLNFNQPLSDEQALNFDFNFYNSDDEGKKLAGDVDNRIWSLAAAYSLGAHKFTVAHQRSTGDTGYLYGIDGGGTVYLANSVQYSDFNGKDERSWQARYDINMASYGVPGLSFMTRYVYGDNIDVGTGSDAKERELNIEAKYVLQDGPAKDLSFRVRNSIYRADSSYGGDVNDLRLIVEYPLEIL
ncbi:OprD family porin [Pseudomonas mangiferae]|uniref:OprD family porin n=1 Tax=Pseudomonas mangiferae TaxID=2593654 RepID=A0A553H1L0_9PSED|nr:OprD family porin [Pseudomonas mangiferae]TRX75613.1 OprD family porin [Pseudomonas mangiferae]